jgi:Tol biopolymer transport system component
MKKKIIFSVCGISIIIALFLISYFMNKTYYNDPSVLGNSSGNLFNGGLFCESDGKIYFSNPNDEGRIYSMDEDFTNFKKLSSDTGNYLNVAGKYIVYGRHNELQSKTSENVFALSKTGMYRMDTNGKKVKTLFDSAVAVINQYGNTIYYQHNTDDGFGTSMIEIDKTKKADLTEEPIFPYAITDGTLYYVGVLEDHNIYKMDLTSKKHTLLLEGNYAFVTVNNDNLYYMDLENNHTLCRMDRTGGNPEVLVDTPISTYNVTPDGKYLYYEMDDGENIGIYCMDLGTKSSSLITSGAYCQIHTTSNYTFFRSSDEVKFFYVSNGTSQVYDFSPEVLSK